MKDLLRPDLQLQRHHGLCDSVGHGGHPQCSGAPTQRFRYFHRFHRRRKVGSRGHPIPDLVEIVLQIGLEILIVTPSPPAAPLLAATRLYASHTSCFGISNDLVVWPDLPTRLLPEDLSGCSGEHLVDDPAPSLPAHYRRFTTTTSRSASRRHDGTQHLPVLAG